MQDWPPHACHRVLSPGLYCLSVESFGCVQQTMQKRTAKSCGCLSLVLAVPVLSPAPVPDEMLRPAMTLARSDSAVRFGRSQLKLCSQRSLPAALLLPIIPSADVDGTASRHGPVPQVRGDRKGSLDDRFVPISPEII